MPADASKCILRTLATLDTWIEEEARSKSTRPLKQMEGTGSCTTCRRLKAKCGNADDGSACERCVKMSLDCTYPGKTRPGRKKGFSRRAILLEETRRDLVDALEAIGAGSTLRAPTLSAASPSSPSSSIGQVAPSASGSSLESVPQETLASLENPLAILASLSLSDSASDSSRATERGGWTTQAQRFYSTGLNDTRDDVDPSNDPVNLGLLTEEDLARLVTFYFENLWPFLWQLTPQIHSAQFLRQTSPFLTTCFAATVAMYDPTCTPTQAKALQTHAEHLAVEVFRQQHRTIEVVQGFTFLAHWLPPAETWSQDRSYSWVGMAVRIATELGLQEPFKPSDFIRYRSLTPVSDELYPYFCENRIRSWTLLFCADLAVSVHTGRLSASNGLMFTSGALNRVPPPPPTDPYYSFRANEALNRVLVKAIVFVSTLEQDTSGRTDLRETFLSTWRDDLIRWASDWTAVSMFVRLQFSHIKLMLLSLSLRFPGPTQPILEERQSEALRIVQTVAGWEDNSINYASNFAVVVIAYGAITALTFLNAADTTSQPQVAHQILELCSKVVQALLRIAVARPNAPSMASVHAVRISRLISSISGSSSTALPAPSTVLHSTPAHFALDPPPLESSTWAPTTELEPLSMDFMNSIDDMGELGSLEQSTSLAEFWNWDSGAAATEEESVFGNDLLGGVGHLSGGRDTEGSLPSF